MKRILYVFSVLFLVCVIPIAAFAAEHKIEVMTDGDRELYGPGEEVNVSINVTLGESLTLTGMNILLEYDTEAFSVVDFTLSAVEGLTFPLPVNRPGLIGGAVGSLGTAQISAGIKVPLRVRFKIETTQTKDYVLAMQVNPDDPDDATRTCLSNGEVVIASTKIPKTIKVDSNFEAVGDLNFEESAIELKKGDAARDLAYTFSNNPTIKTVTLDNSNSDVAEVVLGDGKVTITAIDEGETVITLTADGDNTKTATCTVTVLKAVEVDSVTISSKTLRIPRGENRTLTATVTPPEANQNVTWSSNNTSVATVANGLVVGVSAGVAVITVTADGDKTDTCNVTVTQPVTGVTIEESEEGIIVDVGDEKPLHAIIEPENATDQNVTWKSDDDTIATVSATGVVKGVSEGKTTITVTTVDGEIEATCEVTVNSVPVESVTIEPETATIAKGETVVLTVVFTPENATNKNVTWESEDDTIASVTATGVVLGVSKGTTRIIVTTEEGEHTATCEVTVNDDAEPTFKLPDGTPPEVQPYIGDIVYFKEGEEQAIVETIRFDSVDLTLDSNGNLVIDPNIVKTIGHETLEEFDENKIYELPIFEVTLPEGATTVAVDFEVRGSSLYTKKVEDVVVMKIFADKTGEPYVYEGVPEHFGDKKYTILKNDVVFKEEVQTGEMYKLVLFIKDSGSFDLDGKLNQAVIDPTVVLGKKEDITIEPKEVEMEGGCNVGYGYLLFAIMGVIPFIVRKK